jgi:hypothetical protein
MLGRGRQPIRPQIGNVRELTREEVLGVKRSRTQAIQRFRDSHHRMARLFASGLRVTEVASLTGYSVSRVSLFHNSPAFQDLIAEKRKIEEEIHRDQITAYNALILSNGIKAERKIADKLDDDDEAEEMSVRELVSIARDSADRVGLSKRSINFSVNTDFAALLDRAIERSAMPRSGDLKLIEAPSSSTGPLPPDRGPSSKDDLVLVLKDQPLKRRI